MSFLNVVLMIVMALGLIHCGEEAEPRKPGDKNAGDPNVQVENLQPLILMHNASNDEDVYYSFNGSTDKGFPVEPDTCLKFSALDLAGLTVWATAGGIAYIGEPIKVLCGSGEEVAPCEGGSYEITDTAWTAWDNYTMEVTEEELDEASCLEVSTSPTVESQTITEDGVTVLN